MTGPDPSRRRKSRLLLAIAGFFLVVPVLVVGIALYGSHDRPPALAVDLPTDPAGREAMFRGRIEAAFPPGTPAARVAEVLKTQGFSVLPAAAEGWTAKAEIRVEKLVCAGTYRVRWRADEDGKVAKVEAAAGSDCD